MHCQYQQLYSYEVLYLFRWFNLSVWHFVFCYMWLSVIEAKLILSQRELTVHDLWVQLQSPCHVLMYELQLPNLQLPSLLIFEDHCLGWQIIAMVAILYLQFACSLDLSGSHLWSPIILSIQHAYSQSCHEPSLLCLVHFCEVSTSLCYHYFPGSSSS